MIEQQKKGSGTNILTFDIEEWFHANYDFVDKDKCRDMGSNFRAQMDTLLNICRARDCKATFFVLGSIGESYPDVVREIARQGHEVASHGYSHELAYRQSAEEFREDVKKSVEILEDLTGVKVHGYRAPSWSIVESNLHYLEILENLGLKYDASIFPVKTFLYGIPDARTDIHRPVVNGKELNLLEVPMSVAEIFGRRIGFSGGFYFRFFPRFFIKHAIELVNGKGKSAIVYLHPRELDADERRLTLPLKEHFIHYFNIGGAKDKLNDILGNYNFTSVIGYLTEKLNKPY